MRNRTILFFLREFKFAEQYFLFIIQQLQKNYNVVVVHFSKLNEASADNNYNLKNIDLSDLSNKEIQREIKNLNPLASFITNFRSLSDIYWMDVCRSNNVKLIYVEHGIILQKAINFKFNNRSKVIAQYLNYTLKIFPKLFSGNGFIKGILSYYLALVKSNYASFNIDYAMLYAQNGKNVLGKVFDLEKAEIEYAGYPICLDEEQFDKLINCESERTICFIHQPLIADGYSKLTFDEEFKNLAQLNELSAAAGYNFIIKLHPRDDIEFYKNALPDLNIVNDLDTNELISKSSVVVGQFSTALFTAIILKKPIMILDFGDLTINSVDYFLSVGMRVTSVSEFGSKLLEMDGFRSDNVYDHFIDQNIGVNNYLSNRLSVVKHLLNKIENDSQN